MARRMWVTGAARKGRRASLKGSSGAHANCAAEVAAQRSMATARSRGGGGPAAGAARPHVRSRRALGSERGSAAAGCQHPGKLLHSEGLSEPAVKAVLRHVAANAEEGELQAG